MLYALITLLTIIATALPSAADIYKYRDASGKLVISNQPPPAGADIESQRESTPLIELPVTHIFYFRDTWGMLGRTSHQQPQDQPVMQGHGYEFLRCHQLGGERICRG
jgi:hypothetical protein